jgi:hypothetical protein
MKRGSAHNRPPGCSSLQFSQYGDGAAGWTISGDRRIFSSLGPVIIFIIISGVGLSPLGIAATSGLLYKLQMVGEGDCGVIGGMRIGRGNRSTRRKSAPAPLCPPQIPHDQTRDRTRAAAVGSQRLTAWAMARPCSRAYPASWTLGTGGCSLGIKTAGAWTSPLTCI